MDKDSLRRLFCYCGCEVEDVKTENKPPDRRSELDLQSIDQLLYTEYVDLVSSTVKQSVILVSNV